MRILNLYCGIGGNRKLWGNEHEITAIENNESIANVYQDLYPYDTVLIGDAHQYLLDHYKEFDFIWASPPCPSHSRARFWGSKGGTCAPVYPEMELYQEILFCQHFLDCKYVIENVKPYYKPMIKHNFTFGRHLFWSNIDVSYNEFEMDDVSKRITNVKDYDFKVDIRKDKVIKNQCDPKIGKHILDCVQPKTLFT